MPLQSDKSNGTSGSLLAGSRWTNVIGLITLGLLIVSGGVYYDYISDKEAYLTDRNFRLLAIWSKELTTTLTSYEKVFESSVTTADTVRKESSDDHRKIFERAKQEALQVSTSQQILDKLPSGRLKNPQVLEYKELEFKENEDPPGLKGLTITSHRHLSGNAFHLRYIGPFNSPKIELTAEIEMASLLQEIVTEPLFEDVLLADPAGMVVYQKNPIQFRWSDLQVLLQNQVPEGFLSSIFNETKKAGDSSPAGGDPPEIPKPALRTVSLGGTTYHLFIQPVLIPFGESSPTNEPPQGVGGDTHQDQNPQWVLAGLIPSQTFRNEYLSIPYTYSLLFAFLVLMLFLSLPLARLWMMNTFERIRLFNVLSLTLASLVGAAVVTFFFWDAYFFLSAKKALNDQLRYNGELIHSTFQEELRRMLWQLEQYDLSANLTQDLSSVMQNHSGKKELSVARASMTNPCPIDHKGQETTSSKFCYQHYDLVFWMDLQGQLRVNWTRDDTPAVKGIMDLTGREYVRQILFPDHISRNRLWHLDLDLQDTYEKPDFWFYIQPIISWTTGWNSIVLSMPSTRIITDSKGEKAGLKVAAMETRLSSLMKYPVVPKGTGFAVFQDHDGLVLFHSQGKRNLRENFFAETDHNAQLKGLVAARNAGSFEGQYWGTGHQFYVRPMEHLPWSLVVYRDKSLLRSTNFEILLLSGSLFTIYAIVILGILLVGFFLARSVLRGKAGWMWPAEALNSRYHYLTLGNLLFLMAETLLFKIGDFSATTNLVLVISLPLAWIFVVFLGISLMNRYQQDLPSPSGATARQNRRKEEKLFPYRKTYMAMVLSFLLVLSVWPASILFELAHQAEMTLLLKFNLLEFGRPLVKYQKLAGLQPFQLNPDEDLCRTAQAQPRCLSPTASKTPGGSQFIFTESDLASQGVFKDFTFPTRLIFEPESEGPRSTGQIIDRGGMFERFHRFIRIPSLHGIESMETWGLISSPDSELARLQEVSQEEHLWETSDRNIALLLSYVPHHPASHSILSENGTVRLVSTLPLPSGGPAGLSSLFSGPSIVLYVLFFLFLWLLWVLQRGIFRRIFFLDTNVSNPGPSRLSISISDKAPAPHLLILGLPGAGKSRWLDKQKTVHWNCEDLRKIMDSTDNPDWAQSILARLSRDIQIVALDHFEYHMGVPAQDEEKQRLLRQLFLRKDLRIVILSTMDPTHTQIPPTASSASEEPQTTPSLETRHEVQAWTALLESFVTVPFREAGEEKEMGRSSQPLKQPATGSGLSREPVESLIPVLREECRINQHMRNLGHWLSTQSGWQSMTKDQFFSHILDLARIHYQAIWSACTLEEKLALFFLAKDRFLHFRNPGLPLALQKGLVVWGPDLRLMNESFRRFVLGAGPRENLLRYEKAGGASLWTLVKWPLVLVLLVGITFLIGTQQEFRTSLVTLVSVLPVLLPAVSELPGIFQGNRNTSLTDT